MMKYVIVFSAMTFIISANAGQILVRPKCEGTDAATTKMNSDINIDIHKYNALMAKKADCAPNTDATTAALYAALVTVLSDKNCSFSSLELDDESVETNRDIGDMSGPDCSALKIDGDVISGISAGKFKIGDTDKVLTFTSYDVANGSMSRCDWLKGGKGQQVGFYDQLYKNLKLCKVGRPVKKTPGFVKPKPPGDDPAPAHNIEINPPPVVN